jgi:hypothetical protein
MPVLRLRDGIQSDDEAARALDDLVAGLTDRTSRDVVLSFASNERAEIESVARHLAGDALIRFSGRLLSWPAMEAWDRFGTPGVSFAGVSRVADAASFDVVQGPRARADDPVRWQATLEYDEIDAVIVQALADAFEAMAAGAPPFVRGGSESIHRARAGEGPRARQVLVARLTDSSDVGQADRAIAAAIGDGAVTFGWWLERARFEGGDDGGLASLCHGDPPGRRRISWIVGPVPQLGVTTWSPGNLLHGVDAALLTMLRGLSFQSTLGMTDVGLRVRGELAGHRHQLLMEETGGEWQLSLSIHSLTPKAEVEAIQAEMKAVLGRPTRCQLSADERMALERDR